MQQKAAKQRTILTPVQSRDADGAETLPTFTRHIGPADLPSSYKRTCPGKMTPIRLERRLL